MWSLWRGMGSNRGPRHQVTLKGTLHELRFAVPIKNIWILGVNVTLMPPVSTTPVANCHRYQRHRRQICHRCHWHRWQIMGTISGCRNLKVNLKAKIYIYVSSTTQRWPNKIIKSFLIDDFYHLPLVSLTPVANLEMRISPWIFEKIRNGLNGLLWGWGEIDSWKEPEAKNLVTLSL